MIDGFVASGLVIAECFQAVLSEIHIFQYFQKLELSSNCRFNVIKPLSV